MRQPMSSRERVLIALVVCLTLAIVPMTALAATGQLVNIADGANAARIAKVTAQGELLVQAHPDIPDNAFYGKVNTASIGWVAANSPSTQRAAVITEATLSLKGTGQALVNVSTYAVPTASTCGTLVGGSTPHDVRNIVLSGGSTIQLTFPVPLRVVASTGYKVCVGFVVSQLPTGGRFYGGVTGYYVP